MHTIIDCIVVINNNCCIQCMLIEGGKRHIIGSVGDDNALTVSEVEIITVESTGSPVVKLIRQGSEKNAHSSSITGTL